MRHDSVTKEYNVPRYLSRFLLIVSTGVSLLSCVVYGPSTEQKSVLDLLSEKNYQETASVLGIPVLKSKKRNTIIEGTVYIHEIIPMHYVKLRLLNSEGKTVSKTTTSYNGNFEFMDYIINGKYLLKIDSAQYSGEIKIEVNGYQLHNIIIDAKPIQLLQNGSG